MASISSKNLSGILLPRNFARCILVLQREGGVSFSFAPLSFSSRDSKLGRMYVIRLQIAAKKLQCSVSVERVLISVFVVKSSLLTVRPPRQKRHPLFRRRSLQCLPLPLLLISSLFFSLPPTAAAAAAAAAGLSALGAPIAKRTRWRAWASSSSSSSPAAAASEVARRRRRRSRPLWRS